MNGRNEAPAGHSQQSGYIKLDEYSYDRSIFETVFLYQKLLRIAMIKALTMWKLPAGVSETDFEHWYATKHVPDVKKVKELRSYVTCKIVPERAGPDGYYRMAEFTFDSLEDMDRGMSSPEWKAAVADAGAWIASPMRLVSDATQQIP